MFLFTKGSEKVEEKTFLLLVWCQALEGDAVSARGMRLNNVYSLGVELFLNSFVRFPLLVIHLVWCVCTSNTVETARNLWPFQLNQWQLKSWILLLRFRIRIRFWLPRREKEKERESMVWGNWNGTVCFPLFLCFCLQMDSVPQTNGGRVF